MAYRPRRRRTTSRNVSYRRRSRSRSGYSTRRRRVYSGGRRVGRRSTGGRTQTVRIVLDTAGASALQPAGAPVSGSGPLMVPRSAKRPAHVG